MSNDREADLRKQFAAWRHGLPPTHPKFTLDSAVGEAFAELTTKRQQEVMENANKFAAWVDECPWASGQERLAAKAWGFSKLPNDDGADALKFHAYPAMAAYPSRLMNKQIHSHSNMQTFNTCPLQYHETVVEKNFVRKYTKSKQQMSGDDMHTAFEKALLHGMESLPPKYDKHQGAQMAWARLKVNLKRLTVDGTPPDIRVEWSAGIEEDGSPCDFWASECHFRGRLDVVMVSSDNRYAYMGDFKNGKSSYSTPAQLRRSALLLFRNEPLLEVIMGEYLWTTEAKRDTFAFTRADNTGHPSLKELQAELMYDVSLIDKCKAANKWPAVRSGLCKAHCVVDSCIHYGK